MQIRFVKNIQFTKVIKAEGRMREFNFRKPNGREQALCTVDVSDDRGHRIVFNMQKEDNSWKILSHPPVPAWVSALENKFSELIEEELQNY
ncbi:MAG: hypothetical protein EOP04_28630 [Proteobacteria bacterium]|nr:MAG: hypothetical protein EOP04_28630 [Pseudomonadota bacterium]